MVAMAKNLDLRVVAEGVETKAQYDFLKSINCDEVQGYYFFKPLSAQHLGRMLSKTPDQRLACNSGARPALRCSM
jgi:EAL domain-containing protein (putative c-di-GMP-specific phosphodiesterase class I)